MLKEIYTEIKVPCYYRLENGSTIEHCKSCGFFNGVVEEDGEIKGVDCLRNEVGSIGAHVTKFQSGDYEYSSREYDKEIDGEIEGDDPYDYCQKCCFNKILANGNDICLLRCGTSGDESSSFCCYEGEIWVKEKIGGEDEDINEGDSEGVR